MILRLPDAYKVLNYLSEFQFDIYYHVDSFIEFNDAVDILCKKDRNLQMLSIQETMSGDQL
jgi:hypothetical protein